MDSKKAVFLARIQALLRAFLAVFGFQEVAFLLGLWAFFHGVSGIMSRDAAFAACGVILMLVSLGSIVFARPKGGI
jgi:hypothetical protein